MLPDFLKLSIPSTILVMVPLILLLLTGRNSETERVLMAEMNPEIWDMITTTKDGHGLISGKYYLFKTAFSC